MKPSGVMSLSLSLKYKRALRAHLQWIKENSKSISLLNSSGFLLPTTRLGQGNIFSSVCTPAGTAPGRYIPEASTTHPGAVHAGRYMQLAGGTHPTGMHSCLNVYLQRVKANADISFWSSDLRVFLHQATAEAKTKKIFKNVKTINDKNDKLQKKYSLSL